MSGDTAMKQNDAGGGWGGGGGAVSCRCKAANSTWMNLRNRTMKKRNGDVLFPDLGADCMGVSTL